MKIPVLIVFSAALFGFGFPVMKFLLRHLDPTAMILIRVIAATLFFLPFALRRRPRVRLSRSDLLRVVASGLTGIVANQLLFLYGLQQTTASHSSVISSAIPVFTLVIASALGYERLSFGRILGFLLALTGISYLADMAHLPWGSETFRGDLLSVGNTLCYSTYLVISRPLSHKFSAYWVNAATFFVGLCCLTPVGLGPLIEVPWSLLPLTAWLALGYLVVDVTLAAYGLTTWLLRNAPSSSVAQGVYVQPLVAIGTSALFLGEPVTPRVYLGAAIVLSGVAAANLRGSWRRFGASGT